MGEPRLCQEQGKWAVRGSSNRENAEKRVKGKEWALASDRKGEGKGGGWLKGDDGGDIKG